MITFDEKGHVHPYEVIEMTLGEFERVFVENMEDKNHRRKLFDNYLHFLHDLKKGITISFFQWIDGSFTTTKSHPGDIDVVSFIDYDFLVKNAHIIKHFSDNSKKLYDVDAHFAVTCSWRHRFHESAIRDERLWKKIFGFSRADDDGIKHPKGLIKLNY